MCEPELVVDQDLTSSPGLTAKEAPEEDQVKTTGHRGSCTPLSKCGLHVYVKTHSVLLILPEQELLHSSLTPC